MPYRANYPRTVREILNPARRFKPAALQAVRELRSAKAWQGSRAQRFAKLRRCCRAMAAAYNIPRPRLIDAGGGEFHSGSSCYMPALNVIRLSGRLSVVTFLHEFAHARGFDERQAVAWSVNLFRRVFPVSFSNCKQVGHTLIKRS